MQDFPTMELMHPGPNIKKRRKAKDLTLEALALAVERQLGKPVNTGNLSRLERGKQGYSHDLISAIASALDTEPSQLFSDKSIEPDAGTYKAVTIGPALEAHDSAGITPTRMGFAIPVMDFGGSMGPGRAQPEYETILGHLAVSPEWVQSHLPQVSSPRNLRLTTGYGDSMWDSDRGGFQDGDPLFVDVGYREVKLDAVYMFELNGEVFIKRLQRNPDGSITANSDNRAYGPFRIENRDQVRVIGRIMGAWNWRKF